MPKTSRSHVHRSEEQWRRLIDEQLDSGQTREAFCRGRGIAPSSFQHWKRKLERVEPDTSPDWVELPVDLPCSTVSWDIELSLGDGLVLRLRRG